MIAEARSTTAPRDQARCPAEAACPPGRRRLGEPTRRGRRTPTRTNADLTRRALAVTDLVTRARNGDNQAWDTLVGRYAPLIWSICRRLRLDDADAADVSQNVWLQLVHYLDKIHDPAALPGWLATVTRRECLRILGATRRPLAAGNVMDAETIPDEQDATAEQELLAAERHAALREALGDLPPSGQQLILLLLQDPPLSYADISARLGVPVGSIGPSHRLPHRHRRLRRVRPRHGGRRRAEPSAPPSASAMNSWPPPKAEPGKLAGIWLSSPADRTHTSLTRHYSSGLLNFAAHLPKKPT